MTVENDPLKLASATEPETSTSITTPTSASSEAIQAGPPDGDGTIPLPPLTASVDETSPEQLAREIARLDWGMKGIVLVLAFLLASFAVRNSDFWLHLATGRLYAHGQFNFGVDPFSYATGNTYWINHSWLYDLLLYGLVMLAGGPESAVGGAVLVVTKAILLTALTWVLLRIRRPNQSLWAPAVCTAIALVAMSPRLLLQPSLVSYLFLAITLYVLQSPRHEETPRGPTAGKSRSPLAGYWLLPPLFLLWANLDSWFLLGPATVLLFLLGQALQQFLMPIRTGPDAPEPRQLGTLALVLVVGVAACLVNPHHYHAFTLPSALSPDMPISAYERDPVFRQMFFSAWNDEYWLLARGFNVAGWAYVALVVAGLASFGLSLFAGWRWWRLLVWFPFAALAAYQIRHVGFFAVISAPITALNIQDFVSGQLGLWPRTTRLWKTWSIAGRVLALAAGVVLVLAAWPGWLHGKPSDISQSHRVAWSVSVDASLRDAAKQVASWRSSGLLRPEENGFNYSPDFSNYAAWFCVDDTGQPRQKGFCDYRVQFFPEKIARAYVDIRDALRSGSSQPTDFITGGVRWQDEFREHNITHVIVNRSDLSFPLVWGQMLQNWDQWALLSIGDGRTCIFRWNDPQKRTAAPPSPLKRFDPNPLAFGAHPRRAPDEGPGRGPEPPDLLSRFLYGPPPLGLAEEEAARYLEYFELVGRDWTYPFLTASEFGIWTGVVGNNLCSPALATTAGPGTLALTSAVIRSHHPAEPNRHPAEFHLFFRYKDAGPAGAPLLAVRAAREAIKVSPNDYQPYLTLARAYETIWAAQEQQWISRPQNTPDLLPRQRMRQIQIVTALENSLKLPPTNPDAHLKLFRVYTQNRCMDLGLDHLRECYKTVNLAGARPGESPDDFRTRRDELQRLLKNVETQVAKLRNEYDTEAVNRPLMEKLGIALRSGLGKKALELLLDADLSQMDEQEARSVAGSQLFLLLSMGRTDDVRARLEPELKALLGTNYEWYNALLEVAVGNYDKAGANLEESIAQLDKFYTDGLMKMVELQTFGGAPQGNIQGFATLLNFVRQAAEYRVLRGMVAVEQGDIPTAAKFFQAALDMNNGEPFEFESKMIAVNYLKHIQAAGGVQ
jgi:hypothetical protein